MSGRVKVPAKESAKNQIYNNALMRSVDEKVFFLEAGQGRNVNGNVFALLRYIRSQKRFDDWSIKLALVPDKFNEAGSKFDKYSINGVKIVEFGNSEYREGLATAKYLITDNSFPAYFYKRPEQVYLNTWHGTPLKALGRTDIDNAISIANVQANMVKADYLLYPNRFTKDIMMKDFMMEGVFGNSTVVCDYPRNDTLHREEFRDEISEKYGLKGKKVIAYMPTWRGTGRDADADEQLAKTEEIIAGLDERLNDDEVLFVNLHFLIGSRINFAKYDKVFGFPVEYETYDFLACCDVLITDYSSVAIDFAGTGKDIILFIYDYEQYKKDKGFYLDVKELPFRKVYSLDELAGSVHEKGPKYKLNKLLQSCNEGRACEKMIRLMIDGDEEGLEVCDCSTRRAAPLIAYFENINRDDSREMIRKLEEEYPEAESRPVIMFPNNMTPETIETLKSLDKGTDFVRVSGRFYCSNEEFNSLWMHKKTGLFRTKAEDIYRREAMRNIGQFRSCGVEVMQCRNADRLSELSILNKDRKR